MINPYPQNQDIIEPDENGNVLISVESPDIRDWRGQDYWCSDPILKDGAIYQAYMYCGRSTQAVFRQCADYALPIVGPSHYSWPDGAWDTDIYFTPLSPLWDSFVRADLLDWITIEMPEHEMIAVYKEYPYWHESTANQPNEVQELLGGGFSGDVTVPHPYIDGDMIIHAQSTCNYHMGWDWYLYEWNVYLAHYAGGARKVPSIVTSLAMLMLFGIWFVTPSVAGRKPKR